MNGGSSSTVRSQTHSAQRETSGVRMPDHEADRLAIYSSAVLPQAGAPGDLWLPGAPGGASGQWRTRPTDDAPHAVTHDASLAYPPPTRSSESRAGASQSYAAADGSVKRPKTQTQPPPRSGGADDAIDLGDDDETGPGGVPPARERRFPARAPAPAPAPARAPARAPAPEPAPAAARPAVDKIEKVQDVDPDDVIVMMSQVYIGTFDAGAAEVKFDSKRITFMLGNPTPGSNLYMIAHLVVTSLNRFEVDKASGTLCMWGMFDLPFADELNGDYQPFLSQIEAEASIFMQFNKADFPRTSWPSDILKMHPKFSQVLKFTTGHMGRVGRPLAAHAPAAAKKPAPKPKAQSSQGGSQGGRQQKAAVSGGAGSSSGGMQQTLTGGRYAPLALQPSGAPSGSGAAASRDPDLFDVDPTDYSTGSTSRHFPTAAAAPSRRHSTGSIGGHSGGIGGLGGSGGTYRSLAPPRKSTRLNREPWQLEADSHARNSLGDSNRIVLVYPDEQTKDAVTLTDEELQRLIQNEYLNDTLVDYKLKQIQASLPPELLRRCHFFNSFFFKRLMQSIGGNKRRKDPAAIAEGYKAVQRWTKSVDLFAKEFVFVPINESLHWSLAIIHRPGAFLASLRNGERSAATAAAAAAHEASDVAAASARSAAGAGSGGVGPWAPGTIMALDDEADTEPDDDDADEDEEEAGEALSGEANVEEEAASAQWAGGGMTAPQFDDEGHKQHHEEEDDDDAVVNPPSTDVTTTRRADQPPSLALPAAARPSREPCIMYLDSMGGSKQKAFQLLKIYLDLERKDKEAKGTAGKPLKEEGASDTSIAATSPAAASPAASPPAASAAPPAASAAPPLSSQKSEDCEIVEPTVGAVNGASGRADGSVDLTAEVHEYRGEFDKMPEYIIKVPQQNNSVDCGLYMLQFVSRVAHEQPDLAGARKRRWEDAECLSGGKLGSDDLLPQDITEMRGDMYRTIKDLGKEQQAQKKPKAEVKAEVKAESKAEGARSVAAGVTDGKRKRQQHINDDDDDEY